MLASRFHPVVQQWFADTLGEPTAAQARGWAAIRERPAHADRRADRIRQDARGVSDRARRSVAAKGCAAPLPDEVRVVYVSPLKALSADIHKNLAEPRRGIRRIAEDAGLERAADHRRGADRRHDRSPSARRCCARRRTSWSRRPSRCTCC